MPIHQSHKGMPFGAKATPRIHEKTAEPNAADPLERCGPWTRMHTSLLSKRAAGCSGSGQPSPSLTARCDKIDFRQLSAVARRACSAIAPAAGAGRWLLLGRRSSDLPVKATVAAPRRPNVRGATRLGQGQSLPPLPAGRCRRTHLQSPVPQPGEHPLSTSGKSSCRHPLHSCRPKKSRSNPRSSRVSTTRPAPVEGVGPNRPSSGAWQALPLTRGDRLPDWPRPASLVTASPTRLNLQPSGACKRHFSAFLGNGVTVARLALNQLV